MHYFYVKRVSPLAFLLAGIIVGSCLLYDHWKPKEIASTTPIKSYNYILHSTESKWHNSITISVTLDNTEWMPVYGNAVSVFSFDKKPQLSSITLPPYHWSANVDGSDFTVYSFYLPGGAVIGGNWSSSSNLSLSAVKGEYAEQQCYRNQGQCYNPIFSGTGLSGNITYSIPSSEQLDEYSVFWHNDQSITESALLLADFKFTVPGYATDDKQNLCSAFPCTIPLKSSGTQYLVFYATDTFARDIEIGTSLNPNLHQYRLVFGLSVAGILLAVIIAIGSLIYYLRRRRNHSYMEIQ